MAGLKDLPGARIDIINWEKFLHSDLGGAWTAEEITVLRKPYSSDVEQALLAASDSYCFVAFSGHGSEGSVVLNDHLSNYSIDKLKPRGKKGTLLIDSCRGVEDATTTTAKLAAANESLQGRSMQRFEDLVTLNRAKAASVAPHLLNWITALKNTSDGIVNMFSCSKGQSAGENARSGGYYTSLILKAASDWDNQYSASKILTTKEAHDYAASKLPVQQKPEYKPTSLAFPFAAKE